MISDTYLNPGLSHRLQTGCRAFTSAAVSQTWPSLIDLISKNGVPPRSFSATSYTRAANVALDHGDEVGSRRDAADDEFGLAGCRRPALNELGLPRRLCARRPPPNQMQHHHRRGQKASCRHRRLVARRRGTSRSGYPVSLRQPTAAPDSPRLSAAQAAHPPEAPSPTRGRTVLCRSRTGTDRACRRC